MKHKLVVLMCLLAGAAAAQQESLSPAPTNPPPLNVNTNLQLAAPDTINHAGSFGLGPLIGEPTGLGVKYWLSDQTAIDGGAGWAFEDPDGFQLHGDFLYHVLNLIPVNQGQLPLYIGVGGRVKFVEHGDNHAGLRFPIGVSYLFPNSPLEAFAEVAPVLDFAPDVQLQWNGGIGLRYYFH